jgi:pilus assembly protein Flp/PilA
MAPYKFPGTSPEASARVEELQLGTFFGRSRMSMLKSFFCNESGATAIEYGLIAAGISVAIIVTVQSLGSKLSNTFDGISTKLGS